MKSFTRDLIVWIEKNLDKKVMLDDVAGKSGYSKWHLQRLFRHETGMRLATYIRERRLTESALLLKMSGLPVISAAEQFGFTNQQAFTRTFTRHFRLPPARYRQTEDWHFHGLQPSLVSVVHAVSEPEPVWFSPPALSDVTFSYLCDRENLSCTNFHTVQREQGLKKAARLLHGVTPDRFAERFEAAGTCGTIRFILTFGYSGNECVASRHCGSTPGRFLRFSFEGSPADLTELQVAAYRHILPYRAEARRNENDLFIIRSVNDENLLSSLFRGDYYLPVTDNF
ncbi:MULTISPECIES: helix-turn-helix domain-containing protein [Pantoea]|uniref:helix-turn-helix domain-containing protein n=1 Tax=Pantoea TaxID=53335 RepID=UPI00068C0FF3|nr:MULTISPECIES: helix-turn-helix domain-containing protein [Pantoea]